MDLQARAKDLIEAINDQDIAERLSDDLHFRHEGLSIGKDATLRRLKAQKVMHDGLTLACTDAFMRRNIVIASWAWQDAKGRDQETGTWVFSFDREGLVVEWMEP